MKTVYWPRSGSAPLTTDHWDPYLETNFTPQVKTMSQKVTKISKSQISHKTNVSCLTLSLEFVFVHWVVWSYFQEAIVNVRSKKVKQSSFEFQRDLPFLLRSFIGQIKMTSEGSKKSKWRHSRTREVFTNNFWDNRARAKPTAPLRSSRWYASECVYHDLIRSMSLVDLRSRDLYVTSRSKCNHSMCVDELNTMRPCTVL